jgi:hypothetical protein
MKAGNSVEGKTRRTPYLVMVGYEYPKEFISAKGRRETKVHGYILYL